MPTLRNVAREFRAAPVAVALALLRSAGFEVLAQPEEEVFLCRTADEGGPWRRDELRAVLGGGAA